MSTSSVIFIQAPFNGLCKRLASKRHLDCPQDPCNTLKSCNIFPDMFHQIFQMENIKLFALAGVDPHSAMVQNSL